MTRETPGATDFQTRPSPAKFTAAMAWTICAVIVAFSLIAMGNHVLNGAARFSFLQVVGQIVGDASAIVFTVVSALIISRQPRNTIGWLLLAPPLVSMAGVLIKAEIQSAVAPPVAPSFTLLLAAWASNWIWLALIFPILLIPLLFPTGRPPTPRWRWVSGLAMLLIAAFMLIVTFSKNFAPDPTTYGISWSVANPIGLISTKDTAFTGVFWVIWPISLALFTLMCVASLFVRYRRAAWVEKRQIRWLLYVCGLFALLYIPMVSAQGILGELQDVSRVLFNLLLMGFPIAIGIAILRYQLFDIDVIIRRTVTYAIISGALAIVYFGANIVAQGVIGALGGQRNEVAIVASTLAVAALFSPIRRRVQNAIDRRFNRQRYDADKVVADFAEYTARETDLAALQARIVGVVAETIQPRQVTVWVRSTETAQIPAPNHADQSRRRS